MTTQKTSSAKLAQSIAKVADSQVSAAQPKSKKPVVRKRVGSSAAREAAGSKGYPSDLTIVGIIDHWPPPNEALA